MSVTRLCQFLIFLAVVHGICACGSRVRLRPTDRAPALAANCEPYVLPLDSPLPGGARPLGKALYGDTGFSVHCSESEVRERLRRYACSQGADAVRLTFATQPGEGFAGSSCYRVAAELYRLAEPLPPGTHEFLVRHPEFDD
jgi:hypothetical protein